MNYAGPTTRAGYHAVMTGRGRIVARHSSLRIARLHARLYHCGTTIYITSHYNGPSFSDAS